MDQLPSQQEIEDAADRLANILVLAARKKQNPEFNPRYVEQEDMKRAEYFLKEYPGLLPTIIEPADKYIPTEYKWTEDARRILIKGKVRL